MKANLILCSMLAASSAFGAVLDNSWVKGVTDKDPITYKVGEPMKITLTFEGLAGAVPEGEYFLDWKRTGDDGVSDAGKIPFTGKPFAYETKIDRPGFVRLQAYVVDKAGKHYQKVFCGDKDTPEGRRAFNEFERLRTKEVFFDGGWGAEIEKLEPHPEPKDFDAFWKGQFARLDRVPMKADTIEIPCENPAAKLYAVRVDCAGLRPVTGYLSVPVAVASGKTFPARLTTHGYNNDDCNHPTPKTAKDDEIVLDINAHGLKLVEFGATEADRKALRWEVRSHDRTYAFDVQQNADAETAYFNGMVLRVKRALQYLKTVKGWNGKDLIASGWSQGGLQTMWAAGCGEGVTVAESGITWCCDLYMSGNLRLDTKLNLSREWWTIRWTEALDYYDAVYWARRVPKSCFTSILRAGIGDYTCPPTGLAKLYNAIPGPKRILWMQGSEHGYQPPVAYEGRDFVREAK